jgi:23S rRNA (uracil1939-C5)-methyltransferase
VRSADLDIERIAAGGDGVGRAEGMVVFVPRSAPGDRVRVRLDVRKRFAHGEIVELLAPSSERVDPPCGHYRVDRCGGCQLQHMKYESQIAAKRAVVRDSLSRIAKRDVALPELEPSSREWRYRRKLTLAMRRAHGGAWVIGLHPYDDPVGVFQLEDCPITEERVVAVWKDVMRAQEHFPNANELRAAVQLSDDDAVSIVMEGAHDWPARGAFFEAVTAAKSLWWKPVHRARMLVAERGAFGVGGSASFVQVNAAVAERMHAYVLERARAHSPRTVIDAYAGSGATAIPLAGDGARVIAIEADRDAVARCAAALPAGSQAIAARVEDVIARSLPADLVLINPPRTGVHEEVARALQIHAPSPRAVIYVSCDPATLARDLTRLPRYRVASLRSFDMFPQTAHVETVCELVPDGDSA